MPIDPADSEWNSAECAGEVGRQAAARWSGRRLGICAPAECWHVFHPEGECGIFTGEELVVLLLPEHPELRPEEYDDREEVVYVEDVLPKSVLHRIDCLVSEVWDQEREVEPVAKAARGGGWPKGKPRGPKAKSGIGSVPKAKVNEGRSPGAAARQAPTGRSSAAVDRRGSDHWG